MPCAACFSRFRIAMHELREDPKLADRVYDESGYRVSDEITVDNVVTTFIDRAGLDTVETAATNRLDGLKVACYYGCLLTRPPSATGVEEYEYPDDMDELVRKLGATTLDWNYKTDCCGGSLQLSQMQIALDLSRKIITDAKSVGADCIVTACPLCHANLDMRQRQMSDQFDGDYTLPIFYVTQLMGVAMGVDKKRLGMEKHFSPGLSMLENRGFVL
jgi:heterodisulfide reductase subunit B